MTPGKYEQTIDIASAFGFTERELVGRAFEWYLLPRFPEYKSLVYVGDTSNQPYLIYRGNDSYLIVDVAITAAGGDADMIPCRQCSAGEPVECGSYEYLISGLSAACQGNYESGVLFADILLAVLEKRVRYILALGELLESTGGRDAKFHRLVEFQFK